jgi:cytochrome c
VNTVRNLSTAAALAVMLSTGCGTPHGQPLKGSETIAPNEILDFETLYAENCAGCHGTKGR